MFNARMAIATLTLLASFGFAQAQTTQQDHDTHHPDANASAAPAAPAAPPGSRGMPGMAGGMGMDKMMGGNMQQMMPMMMQMMGGGMQSTGGAMGPRVGMAGLRHIEGQIAFYKAELHITGAQAPQWDAFADTLRSSAQRLQDVYKGLMQGSASASAPEQLVRRRQMLSAELEALQTIEPAAVALYGALSAEQKKTADELMADHLRRM